MLVKKTKNRWHSFQLAKDKANLPQKIYEAVYKTADGITSFKHATISSLRLASPGGAFENFIAHVFNAVFRRLAMMRKKPVKLTGKIFKNRGLMKCVSASNAFLDDNTKRPSAK